MPEASRLSARRRALERRAQAAAGRAGLGALMIVQLCAGCGPDVDDGSEPGTPSVVLGTGQERYEPIEGEPTLELVKGFQGGFHVWVSFLTYGFETILLRMELSTSWAGDDASLESMAGNVRVREAVDPAGRPARVLVGWPAIIHDPTCAHGRRIRLDLVVRDAMNGEEASDTRYFIAAVAEAERSMSCPP